jgi:PadR family transcriptional regulator, regulatory protein PadR
MAALGEFEQLLLFSVYELGENAYGVTIRELIEERAGRTVSIGAIYTTLGRLDGKGLVRSRVEEPDGSPGRPRKFYALEPSGARALVEAYTTLRAFGDALIPGLTELAEARRG